MQTEADTNDEDTDDSDPGNPSTHLNPGTGRKAELQVHIDAVAMIYCHLIDNLKAPKGKPKKEFDNRKRHKHVKLQRVLSTRKAKSATPKVDGDDRAIEQEILDLALKGMEGAIAPESCLAALSIRSLLRLECSGPESRVCFPRR